MMITLFVCVQKNDLDKILNFLLLTNVFFCNVSGRARKPIFPYHGVSLVIIH